MNDLRNATAAELASRALFALSVTPQALLLVYPRLAAHSHSSLSYLFTKQERRRFSSFYLGNEK